MTENSSNVGLATEARRRTEFAVSCHGVTKAYGSGEAKVAALRGVAGKLAESPRQSAFNPLGSILP
jgi:hypothetical protein